MTLFTAPRSSRSLAAFSNSRFSEASCICAVMPRTSWSVRPDMKPKKPCTISSYSASSTRPTHGAAHLSM